MNESWKNFIGELDDGVAVYVVDGNYVRSHINADFTDGGHYLAVDGVPKGEIWVDKLPETDDMMANAAHEIIARCDIKAKIMIKLMRRH